MIMSCHVPPQQEVISGVSGSYSRSVLWKSSEALVVRLQAVSRGFLIRQKLEARRRYLISQTPAVVTIQVKFKHLQLRLENLYI